MEKKPFPGIGRGPNPPNNASNSNDPFTNHTQAQAQARFSYAQSNASYATQSQITLQDIENAVTSMQNRFPGTSQSAAAAPPAPSGQQPFQTRPPRPPGMSSDTSLIDGAGAAQGVGSGGGASFPVQCQPNGPPILPVISSGEALEWEGFEGYLRTDALRDNGETTPLNAQAGVHQVPHPPIPPQSIATSGQFSSAYDEKAYSRPALAYPVSRPTSAAYPSTRPTSAAFSSYNAPPSQIAAEHASSYAPSQPPSSHGHYSADYPNTPQYDADGQLMVDHYGHDVEAYASGLDSGTGRQIRSRSVTPMGNEEYMSVEDDEDGTEYTDEYEDDPEKGVGYDYGYHNSHHVHFLEPNPNPNQAFVQKSPASEYLNTPVTTQHYGPAPVGRVTRRIHQKRRVQLTNGNLVIDLNVPTKLVLPLRREEEMMKTRYTAVTCDPDDFKRNNFFLRQNDYGRRTELFICITMYNEDEILFCRTLHGVMRNIGHLCTRKNSQTWGQDAWKKVVVCIVADGRKKIHPRVLDCLAALGLYQHGDFMKNLVNNKPVTAHLFEYTTSFGLDENLHFRYPDKGIVPTQIIFCLKEKNQKKINSHRWFFNAFAPLLRPNVCVLIDVGTRPGHKSLYHLWKTFDLNSNVGGACGEIAAYKGKRWGYLLNPLVAAQNFEYKISNILEKPTESLFGYITVLPGAFSAYRYIALLNNKNGIGPLASYFKGEVLHGSETDVFTSNMYLAEDRILCFELAAKENSDWVLRYVKSAVGETDVPDGLPEFIAQRRRWLNGSFFASIYAIAHAAQIIRSGHSTGRKFMLMIETAYNIINLVFAWFALGNFYLFFNIVSSSLEDPAFGFEGISYFNSIIQYAYASIVIGCFLFSMGNRPRAAPWKYKLSAIFFAIINIYAIVAACLCAVQASKQGGALYSAMLFSVIITYGVYAISSLLALDPWHMLTSFIPYMLLSPTYINILNIYAFSNLDDISWGTKVDNVVDTDLGAVVQNSQSQVDLEILTEPADINQMYDETLRNLRTRKPVEKPNTVTTESEKEQQVKDYYANVRTNVLLVWVLSNGLLLLAVLSVGDPSKAFSDGNNASKIYMTFILAFVAITNIIRFAGSTLYMLVYLFTG
ncbi:hypothetical protein ACEPAI_7915 [Sanghuangporus weigelae]